MPGDQCRQLPREAARGGHRPTVEGERMGRPLEESKETPQPSGFQARRPRSMMKETD